MELERLAVAIRPRGGWEAVDLGFTMAREWWRPLWLTWLCVYLPVALLLHFILWDTLWLAILILWWLHPLFERAVLHVVAHAVFDSPPSLRQTLGSAREWLRPGAFAGLSIYRVQLARSLMLPVWQLEKQRGKDARQRRKLLGKRLRGHGIWLTALCGLFVLAIFRALQFIPMLLEPASTETSFGLKLFEGGGLQLWTWKDSLCAVVAYSVIEPFYVCGGFALYLNRRAMLEGWDIEIALRKLAQRAAQVIGIILIVLCLGGTLTASPAYAAVDSQASNSAEAVIKEILAEQEFAQYRSGQRWEPRNKEEKKTSGDIDLDFFLGVGRILARIAQILGWLAAVVVLALLVRAAMRYWGWSAATQVEIYQPPAALFGLDLSPQSLPEDIAATASALARKGQLREALSLLYRGALSALVHVKQVRLEEGATESDCLEAARPALTGSALQYFAHLVDAWRYTAYAKRAPLVEQVEHLCAEWNVYFRAKSTTP